MFIGVFFLSLFFFILISFKVRLPFFPYDNTNKVQSTNSEKIQLNLLIISIPFIFYYSHFQDIIIYLFFFIIGFLDDKYGLNVKSRFIPLFFSLFVYLYLSGNVINFNFYIDDSFNVIKILITIFFVLGFIHTMNMVDGKNGFALLIFLNVLLYLIIKIHFSYEIKNELFFVSLALFFSFCVNLMNKSYLGNSGIILLSIYIGFLLIELYNYNYISIKDIYSVLFLPFLDGMRVTFQRILYGKNVFAPDKNHLHHKINRWNFGITLIFFSLLLMNLINIFFNLDLIFIIIISFFLYFSLLIFFNKISYLNNLKITKNKSI